MRLPNRREFNGLCVAVGSCVASANASAAEPASGRHYFSMGMTFILGARRAEQLFLRILQD
jgi:hypothetical protein